MVEREQRIQEYAESLVHYNVYSNIDDALVESRRWYNKQAKGLVEPLKCPANIYIKSKTTHRKDGSIVITYWSERP